MIDCNNVNLKKGSAGSTVKEVQTYLTYLGLYKRQIDGDYGDYTVTAVKKLQKQYDLVEDGNFGPVTCKSCGINGQDISKSIQTIEVSVFEDMINRFTQYTQKNVKEPNIIYINYTNKYRYITNTKYHDMKTRYDKYVKENGKKPNFCYINKPTATNTDGTFTQKFKDAVGNFNTFREAYNKIKYRKYLGYNNDIYDQATALKRLKNKQGLNCSDISQLLYALAVDMGLQARYVHIRCKSGIGHIVLDVRAKGTNNYTRIDGAAALSSGKAYGVIWCSTGRVIAYNPGWLMTDDGKT